MDAVSGAAAIIDLLKFTAEACILLGQIYKSGGSATQGTVSNQCNDLINSLNDLHLISDASEGSSEVKDDLRQYVDECIDFSASVQNELKAFQPGASRGSRIRNAVKLAIKNHEIKELGVRLHDLESKLATKILVKIQYVPLIDTYLQLQSDTLGQSNKLE